MNDLISRQDTIEEIAKRDTTDGTVKVFSGREIIEILNGLLSAQPERKKGKWIEIIRDDDRYVVCSECKDEYVEEDLKLASWVKQYFNYCPNCGADMRG